MVYWPRKRANCYLYRFGVRLGDDPISLSNENGIDELLSVSNIAADAFRLRPATASTDSYLSAEEISAFYMTLQNEFGSDWVVELGARYEDFSQKISYPNNIGNEGLLETDGVYPAINITWRALEDYPLGL